MTVYLLPDRTQAIELARTLNCQQQGPTGPACEVCESCQALAPGAPGSIDVFEIDAEIYAADEDDTHPFSDRALYSRPQSRYRIFLIEDVHMITVTPKFLPLFKALKRPLPEHIAFIFVTTEPEKVHPKLLASVGIHEDAE